MTTALCCVTSLGCKSTTTSSFCTLPCILHPRTAGGIVCDSLDCGVYFERRKLHYELAAVAALARAGLQQLLEDAS